MNFQISIGFDNQLLIYKITSIDRQTFWAILVNRESVSDYAIPTLVLLEKEVNTWKTNSPVREISIELIVAIEHYLETPNFLFEADDKS